MIFFQISLIILVCLTDFSPQFMASKDTLFLVYAVCSGISAQSFRVTL